MMPPRCTAIAILTACLALPGAHGQTDKGWVGTWATANMPLPTQAQTLPVGGQDLTLRQVVHISQGGKRLRITFTNEFGTTPLHIASAHVAFLSAGSKILLKTDHALTFSGRPEITIAPGTFAASDALTETVPIYSDLVISTAIPQQNLPTITYHSVARTTTFLASGNQTAAEDLNATTTASKSTSWYFLKNVEVNQTSKSAAVVTLGDSITDGTNSTPETNRRYPDALAALLGANKKTGSLSVLNVGIAGNRILHNGTGPDALDRFERDVATQPRARFVILLEGINDIGHNVRPPLQPVTATQVIEGMKALAQRAHAKGLTIFAGTLLPCGGSPYGAPEVEQMRGQINAFIRTGNAFDGVIDFDKAVSNPQQPDHMLAKYDSGDHLHPSDTGYAAMAAAIDLKLFRRKK